jgi:hypothetical protein
VIVAAAIRAAAVPVLAPKYPSPSSLSASAMYLFLGLCLPLPLPCENKTNPFGSVGMHRSASRISSRLFSTGRDVLIGISI